MEKKREILRNSKLVVEKDKIINDKKLLLNKSKTREATNLKKIRDLELRLQDKINEIEKMKSS